MPRTASTGAYAAPSNSWNPAVDATVIATTDWNTLLADIATALSTGAATTRALWPTAAQVQDGTLTVLGSVAGADTITATAPLSMNAYALGQCFRWIAAGTNTGPATLNINSIAAKAITKFGTTALIAGDMVTGGSYEAVYDGTRFQLINPLIVKTGLDFISSATAAASASIVFTAGITSAYDHYLLVGTAIIPATDDKNLLFRVSEDAGATYKAGANDYRQLTNGLYTAANVISSGAANATSIQLASGTFSIGIDNGATEGVEFELHLFNPASAALTKRVQFQSSWMGSDGTTVSSIISSGAYKGTTNAINAVQFVMSSGNITSGTIRLYGVSQS
jgi:hypothetical protein